MKTLYLSALAASLLLACSHNNPPPASGETEYPATTASDLASTDGGTPSPSMGSAAGGPTSTLPAPAPAEKKQAWRAPEPAPATTVSNETAVRTETPATPPPAATPPNDAAPSSPDNTRVNKRDRNAAALLPTDQGGSEKDRTVTQKIRQAVMADDTLSFGAKNVKIITINGRVTLRGPVKTAAERASIERAAKNVAGAAQVDNQLEVKN